MWGVLHDGMTMIICDPSLREWKRLAKARNQPCFPLTIFDMQEELEKARVQHFPGLSVSVACCFVDYGHLACICSDQERKASSVFVHQILNHLDTPREVATLICKHELLHLEIPSREIDGKNTHHPPEFWDRERAICPEKNMAWAWIWENFWSCLRVDRQREGIRVLKDWKARWGLPRIGLSQIDNSVYSGRSTEL